MNAVRSWLRDHPGFVPGAFVYRFLDVNGSTIYVGSSESIQRRMQRHATTIGGEVACVVVTRCANRDEMLAAESTAIRQLNPRHNRRGRTDLPNRRVNRWGTLSEIEACRVERNRLAVEMYRRRKGRHEYGPN